MATEASLRGLSVLEIFIHCCTDEVFKHVLTPLDVHHLASVHSVLDHAVNVRFGAKSSVRISGEDRADIIRRLGGCAICLREHPVVFQAIMDALDRHKEWVRRLLNATMRRPLPRDALDHLFPEELSGFNNGIRVSYKADDFGAGTYIQTTIILAGIYVTITSGKGIHRAFVSTWGDDSGVLETYSGMPELGVTISHAFGVRPRKITFDSHAWKDDPLVSWLESRKLPRT